LEETGFDGCIAVQASQTETENSFLLSLAHQNNFIKGIVGWVDLQAKDIIDRLDHYSQFQKIKGFRHILQDEPDIDFMLRPSFIDGISKLNQYGFTYDILIYPDHLPNAFTLAKSFPNQLFVIDHLAKPNIKKQEIENWSKQIRKIAVLENVFCKVSGMVTESDWNNWKQENFTPYLDTVLDAFGIERLMYGSDWPVCTLSSSYQNTFRIVREYFSKLSLTEQQQFFGGNVTSFYNLDIT
jgi:L-fuconolactonase